MAIKKKDRQTGVIATIYDILNRFRDNKLLDVYVTGSNSKMLSTDIAIEFRGRSVRINVHPLSFKEYFEYVEIDFIVNKLDTKIYITSTFQMLDDDKVKQEVRPFTLTNDFFKKVIIRNDIINSFL